ncbi:MULTISPECIES: pyocin knob domain-containing protein [unclassified Paenibacillus]|uniref:pyocin knob domain-containing protein n=1 Tax=unclassified Paenibacillus TaxID=185978 RepID=UPI0030F9A171
MADFNEQLPEWQEGGIEPPNSKKVAGWAVNDKPPAGWLNWFFNRTYKVLAEIRSVISSHKADTSVHVTAAKQVAWDAKETTTGAQTKADNAQAAAALDATAKANAARDAATLAADAAADAAEAAAKAASIPIGQKGAAGGVVELGANRYISLAGINLSGAVPEIIYTESDTGKIWYQLVDGGVMSFREDDYSGERMQLNSDGMYVSGEVTSSGDMKMTGNAIEIGALIDVPFSTGWARGFTIRNGDISKQFQFGAFGTGVSGELEHAYIGYGSDPSANQVMQWKKDGTMKVFNSTMVKNLNAEFVGGRKVDSFALSVPYINFGDSDAPMTTAEFITLLTNIGAFTASGHWVARGGWAYAYNRTITDSGFGHISLAGAVVEVTGNSTFFTVRILTAPQAAVESDTINSEFIYAHNGPEYVNGWRRSWNSANMPTYTSNSNANTLVARNADGNFAVGNAVYMGANNGLVTDGATMFHRLGGTNYVSWDTHNDIELYKGRQTIHGGANLNDYVSNGGYSLYVEGGAYLNGPPPGYYLLDVKVAASGYVIQDAISVFGTVRFFRARTDGGVWSPWLEIPVKDYTGKIANVSLNRYVALDKPLTTTSSTLLANYVPSKITMVTIKTSMRVAAVRSVSMAVVYTPPGETASRTIYILPENQMAPTDYSFIPLTLTIAANKPVEVHAKTTIADFVYVDVIITEEG